MPPKKDQKAKQSKKGTVRSFKLIKEKEDELRRAREEEAEKEREIKRKEKEARDALEKQAKQAFFIQVYLFLTV